MLYVFHVDTGTMMTFDMKLAMDSVANLQQAIAREYPIPEEKQVLLISGGESLDPSATVGKYHAGTDTNPIFLFSKSTIESQHPPSPSVHYGSDVDIQSQVEGSLLMPPAYGTVVSRAQLALHIHEVDSDELKACEQLVHDQHLQQQGWAAVVANLEDITSALRRRSEIFTESYNEYLIPRDSYLKTLSSVEQSLQLLARIPVLPCLMQHSSTELSSSNKSLFDWISSQDPSHSLHDMVVKCIKATEQLDSRVLETLTKEVQDTFVQVDNPSMKEVKGIEDRLYGLDQILSSGRRVVQEQYDVAQGFIQNQNRVSTLKDKSILPDLCSSHKRQLLVMVSNHKKIQETKKKCKMAKEELAVNLHARLRWVMLVEKRICDVDGKLIIYHENLKRLRKRLEVLKQIHDAPTIYAYLVVEVVRRKKFSSTFTEWASSVAEESTQIHSEEFKRREAFLNQVGRHFLQTLFTGLESFSSDFAMEPPAAVDQSLPDITENDIEMLKSSVPELADLLVVPSESNKIIRSHWGVLTCTTNKPQTPRSLQTSEIEIIHSYDERFYTAVHTDLSLGDQVASSELTSNLLSKSDIGVTSPTEKTEFIMPKSLSEELTKEMQEVSGKKELVESNIVAGTKGEGNRTSLSATGEVSGTSTSSGDQMKSTGSESSSHDKSTESSHSEKKKFPGASPDMETSQEFTTADFYIEDSMPSSIGGTPPKTVDKSEKQPETMETDLTVCKKKLSLTETKLQRLKDFISKICPVLKHNLDDMKSSIKCDKNIFSEDLEKTKQTVMDIIQVFNTQQQNINQINIERIEESYTLEKQLLNEEMENLKSKNGVLEQLLDSLRRDFKQEKDELDYKMSTLEKENLELVKCLQAGKVEKSELELEVKNLKEKLESCNSELALKIKEMELEYEEIKSKHKQEVTELSQQHSLEMEVELDKVRSDLLVQINQLEIEVKSQVDKSQLLQDNLSSAEKDRIKLEEELTTRYQEEKDSIKQILTEEFNEKLSVEKEKYEIKIQELQTTHNNQLSVLKEQWGHDKESELNKIQEHLHSDHNSAISSLKEKLEAEKIVLLNEQKEEMLDKHRVDLMKLNEEFNKYKLQLEDQLKQYTDREWSETEVQTDICKTFQCAIQTDVPSSVSIQLQTEPDILSDLKECESQTEFLVTSVHAQTEINKLKSGVTQTDIWEAIQIETQTEPREITQGETQTDKREETQSETQTALREVIQVEMQTDSWVGVLGVTPSEVSDQCVQTDDLVAAQKCDQASQIGEGADSYTQALKELQEQHQREINQLVSKLEKDKEESCTSLKTSLIAERQVSFNEAVNKVSNMKDSVISELKENEAVLMEKLKAAQEATDRLGEEKSKVEDVKNRALAHLNDKEREFLATKRSLEDEIAMLKQQLTQYQQQIQSMSVMSVSSAPSVMEVSSLDDKESKTKISLLEEEVKQKQEEISRMEQKLADIAMTESTRSVVQDKVSITSCNIGDLALFCLDERHDQYVVFTIGSTLHFLHSDCIEPLGLQPNPSESRKSWVLAEITDKEYCQAKKSQNRFKVPLGTKFYRVKAKPWTRDTSPRKGDTASGSS